MPDRPNEKRINILVQNIIAHASAWQGENMGKGAFFAFTSGMLGIYGYSGLGMVFYSLGMFDTMYGIAKFKDSGFANSIVEFLHHVNSVYYQRYWSLIGSFYSVNDICDICVIPYTKPDGTPMTTSERMVAYYMKAGLPSAVVQQIQRYENNQITLQQLASYMHLDPENIKDVQGLGWDLASNLKRNFANAGISISMSSIKSILEGEADFLDSFTEEQLEECIEVVEFINSNNYTSEQINQLVYEVMVGNPDLIGEYNPIYADATTTTLFGSESHDFIMGNELDNHIYGTAGDDIIIGSGGDDYLHGGQGSDTYLWRIGDGNDIINDVAVVGDANVLFFSEGILAEDISFTRNGNDGVFTYTPTGNTITVENWFSNVANQLAEVKFIDGSIWTTSDINEMLSNISPLSVNASSYQLDKAVMDIAVADLNLARGNGDQVCESLGYVPACDSSTISLSACGTEDDGNVLEKNKRSA